MGTLFSLGCLILPPMENSKYCHTSFYVFMSDCWLLAFFVWFPSGAPSADNTAGVLSGPVIVPAGRPEPTIGGDVSAPGAQWPQCRCFQHADQRSWAGRVSDPLYAAPAAVNASDDGHSLSGQAANLAIGAEWCLYPWGYALRT